MEKTYSNRSLPHRQDADDVHYDSSPDELLSRKGTNPKVRPAYSSLHMGKYQASSTDEENDTTTRKRWDESNLHRGLHHITQDEMVQDPLQES